jgi:uncharacterized protein YbjT (DUF2867 family)
MILVTGATGNVGAEVVRALATVGVPVRALTRDPGRATPQSGVEYVAGDLNRPRSLEPLLPEVRGLFMMPGYPDLPWLLDTARRAGAGRVVLLSGNAVDLDSGNAVSRYMTESERAVRQSGLAWTFLRPCPFMSNTFSWAAQLRTGDVVRAPFARMRTASVDPYDIAAIAVRALLTGGHAGRIYQPTGPEALLPADRLRILGTVLGRDLRFEEQPDDDARAEMLTTTPAEYVDAIFELNYKIDESTVRPTAENVTGLPPRTFHQWATTHAGAFR